MSTLKEAADMHCPYCRHTDTRVLDSRVSEDGTSIRRRRSCSSCEKRFTTVEAMQLTVVKRSGATEAFSRDKVVAGVRKACKGRPVTEDQLACLGSEVEDALRVAGWAEVPAHEVGLATLAPLRELDEVAYLRFASVYRSFASADDFETEIALLRAERDAAAGTSLADPASPGASDGSRQTSDGSRGTSDGSRGTSDGSRQTRGGSAGTSDGSRDEAGRPNDVREEHTPELEPHSG